MTYKATVTVVETGEESSYTLSNANWRGHWACIDGRGGVVMWWPDNGPSNNITTSGRNWRFK